MLAVSEHIMVDSSWTLENQGVSLIGSPQLSDIFEMNLLKIIYDPDICCDENSNLNIRNCLSIYNAVDIGLDPNLFIT